MLRVMFKSSANDPRPAGWPVKHPYWITGRALDNSYSTVVSYADNVDYILRYWPEATDIETQEITGYVFSDRFPKPGWFE